MKRTRLILAWCLVLLLPVLVSCSDPGPTADSAALGTPVLKDRASESQEYMAWIYAQSHDPSPPPESYTYELAAAGSINLATGGSIGGRAATWPRLAGSFWYYMQPGSVDPTSLDDPNATEVEIEIWVPVYDTDFPCGDADMPVILEPDGLRYLPGLEAFISLTYHPALTPTCESGGYYFFEVIQEEGGTYSVPGVSNGTGSSAVATKSLAPPPIVEDPIDEFLCSTNILCQVWHHSRWALSKDDPDGGGGPPILPLNPCN